MSQISVRPRVHFFPQKSLSLLNQFSFGIAEPPSNHISLPVRAVSKSTICVGEPCSTRRIMLKVYLVNFIVSLFYPPKKILQEFWDKRPLASFQQSYLYVSHETKFCYCVKCKQTQNNQFHGASNFFLQIQRIFKLPLFAQKIICEVNSNYPLLQ